jgi:hypothetical protein
MQKSSRYDAPRRLSDTSADRSTMHSSTYACTCILQAHTIDSKRNMRADVKKPMRMRSFLVVDRLDELRASYKAATQTIRKHGTRLCAHKYEVESFAKDKSEHEIQSV